MLSASEVVGRMLEMDDARAAALERYCSQRRYVAANPRFSQRAEVLVEESYTRSGQRVFQVLSASGSSTVRRKVIEELIKAEADAGKDREQARFTPQNYTFTLTGSEEIDGRSCYVLEVTPRASKKYLMRGRIWVDGSDFAVVRIEGSPAKNPSFWTRRVSFIRRYEKHGPFWLPASVESRSDIRIAGKSTLSIEYFQYRIQEAAAEPTEARSPATSGGGQ
jgi:hypothetical protein